MKPAVLLSNNYFLALAFLFGWTFEEVSSCDTKWIRLVYMMSCGKKKRESVWTQNDTFFDSLPKDFIGAFRYFKEKDPFNPMLRTALLYQILDEDEKRFRINAQVPKLLSAKDDGQESFPKAESMTTPRRASSVLINKLFPEIENGNRLGIQGFPDQWNIDEIVEEKINENYRREIDELIDECCKIPPVNTCNGRTFAGACK